MLVDQNEKSPENSDQRNRGPVRASMVLGDGPIFLIFVHDLPMKVKIILKVTEEASGRDLTACE